MGATNKSGGLEQALEALYRRRTFGIKPGLEGMQALLGALENPQRDYAVLHVAGTVGKGAVCTVLDAVLREGGFKCGLYTSPHLVRFNERIRVDGRDISDEALTALMPEVEAAAADVSRQRGREITFFEFATALALLYFARCGVEWVTLETGLGGRLDATNVVDPVLSIITRIGIDHAAHLGGTLAEIAGEKAGIIKRGVPVITGVMPDEARAVIAAVAASRAAACIGAEELVTLSGVQRLADGLSAQVDSPGCSYGRLHLPLCGRFQLENLVTSLAAIDVLREAGRLSCDAASVQRAVCGVSWPGRFQIAEEKPTVVVDGAHNPCAAEALVVAMRERFGRRPTAFVCGFSGDKDIGAFLRVLRGRGRTLWIVPIMRETGAEPSDVAVQARATGYEAEVAETLSEAMSAARRWASACDGVVCVTGSLYLSGAYLALKDGVEKDRLTEL